MMLKAKLLLLTVVLQLGAAQHSNVKAPINTTCHYQSCAKLKELGYPSGNYFINPSPLEVESFEVYCDMESYPGTGITVIDHDSPSSDILYGYDYCSTGYHKTIDYGVSMDDIASLINISDQCTQLISWECQNSYFLSRGSGWLSRDGEKMNYWGGAVPDHDYYCGCGESGTCAGGNMYGNNCNCDALDTTWRNDAGYLIDKRKLPVSGLQFYFYYCSSSPDIETHSKGKYKLGPLKCF